MEVGFFNFLSCREVSRRVGQGRYDDAATPARLLFWIHFIYCRHCRRYRREIRVLARAARHWVQNMQSKNREDFEARLIQRLSRSA